MMKKYMVNMVHPQQIVQKGLKGCKTTRTVTNFAQKNNIPYVWWKPTANQKVMLVDWTQFRQVWSKTGHNPTMKNPTTTNYTHQTTARNFTTKTNTKTSTYGNRTTTNKPRNTQTRYGRTNARKVTYGTTTTRRRYAA